MLGAFLYAHMQVITAVRCDLIFFPLHLSFLRRNTLTFNSISSVSSTVPETESSTSAH